MGPTVRRGTMLVVLVAGVLASVPAAAGPSCGGKRATIVGTGAGERIKGTPGRDVIVAKGGNDVVLGKGGRDVICGNSGNDALDGGPGNDRLYEGPSVPVGTGESCDLHLEGGGGDDRLIGGAAHECLDGGPGEDRLVGGDGWDQFWPGDGDDVMVGGPPDGDFTGTALQWADIVFYDQSPAAITLSFAAGTSSGWGNDTLDTIDSAWGSHFADVLTGDDEDNQIYGQGGQDQVFGLGGDDFLVATGFIDGGTGTDSCQQAATTANCP